MPRLHTGVMMAPHHRVIHILRDRVMPIIPVLHCRLIQPALAFYTRKLDFELVGGDGRSEDPAYCVLARRGEYVILSSHAGDGVAGQAVVITSDDVDAEWARLRASGHAAGSEASRSPVHAGPLEQTWGTREFYVDDPDGNTLRFTQRWFD